MVANLGSGDGRAYRCEQTGCSGLVLQAIDLKERSLQWTVTGLRKMTVRIGGWLVDAEVRHS